MMPCLAAPLSAQSGGEGSSQSVYVAYAGPYSASPASAFGHVFLILANDSTPHALWDVINFAADTEGAGPLGFFAHGIAGGFLGRFERLQLHEKVREYEQLDDRDVWLTELILTTEQREQLYQEIESVSGHLYPYTFFVHNCAYYLQLLLAKVVDGIDPPSGVTSPTGVIDVVLRSGSAGANYLRPAATQQLEVVARNANAPVVARLRSENWDDVIADTTWIADLSTSDRHLVQQFAVLQAQNSREGLSKEATSGLAFLRTINAREESGSRGNTERPAIGVEVPPPEFHGYSRLSIVYNTGEEGDWISMKVRPALHDEMDPWTSHRPINTLEFLSAEISLRARADHIAPRLESFALFSQRSLRPPTLGISHRSWMIEAVASRNGMLGDGIHLAVRTGGGATYALGEVGYAYGLLTTGAVSTGSEATLALGSEAGILLLPMSQWRAGIRWAREHSALRWSHNHNRLQGWLRYDLNPASGIRTSISANGAEIRHSVSIDWYPSR